MHSSNSGRCNKESCNEYLGMTTGGANLRIGTCRNLLTRLCGMIPSVSLSLTPEKTIVLIRIHKIRHVVYLLCCRAMLHRHPYVQKGLPNPQPGFWNNKRPGSSGRTRWGQYEQAQDSSCLRLRQLLSQDFRAKSSEISLLKLVVSFPVARNVCVCV
jgi:hypothetical protein